MKTHGCDVLFRVIIIRETKQITSRGTGRLMNFLHQIYHQAQPFFVLFLILFTGVYCFGYSFGYLVEDVEDVIEKQECVGWHDTLEQEDG